MSDDDATEGVLADPADRWVAVRIKASTRAQLDSFRAMLMQHGTRNLPPEISEAIQVDAPSYTPDLLLQVLLAAGTHLLTKPKRDPPPVPSRAETKGKAKR